MSQKPSILKNFAAKQEIVKVSLPYDNEIYLSLLNEFRIIHLLFHRNKNQHRVAKWWCHLDILHRHLRKILLLMEDINEIIHFKRLSIINFNSNKKSFIKLNEIPKLKEKKFFKKIIKNKKKIKIEKKKYFHNKLNETDAIKLINKKKSLLFKDLKYLYNKIIPNSYWIFMGVIELGQFTNIGFVLIGFISNLWNLLSNIEGININLKFGKILQNWKKLDFVNNNESINSKVDDLGEIVNIETLNNIENNEESSNLELSIKSSDCFKSTENNNDVLNSQITETQTVKPKSNNIMNELFGSSNKEKKSKIKEKEKKKKKKDKKKNAIDDIFGF